MDLNLYDLREDDFTNIIKLGEKVHGVNYLNAAALEDIYRRSCVKGLCCSKVIYDGNREKESLVGFRLTYAPGTWEIDEWCSPKKWEVSPEKICYFKSGTLASNYRGQGIGGDLLRISVAVARRQGAEAGVTHIWMQSPHNSAYKYFSKAGGQLIRSWPYRWVEDLEKSGYKCIVCCKDGTERACNCDGAEMILYFGEENE